MKMFDEYPSLPRWRRFIKKLCGGQDMVAVIVVRESGDKSILWFTGVDMESPIDREQLSAELEPSFHMKVAFDAVNPWLTKTPKDVR